jgi:hypothetical protein
LGHLHLDLAYDIHSQLGAGYTSNFVCDFMYDFVCAMMVDAIVCPTQNCYRLHVACDFMEKKVILVGRS